MIAEADLEPDPGFYESAGGPGTFLNFRKKSLRNDFGKFRKSCGKQAFFNFLSRVPEI